VYHDNKEDLPYGTQSEARYIASNGTENLEETEFINHTLLVEIHPLLLEETNSDLGTVTSTSLSLLD
jgi:hypothetical protein